MFKLSGKRVLVTGASGGIGSAISKALILQGATVALSGTRVETLNSLSAELGADSIVVPAQLGSAEGASILISEVTAALGGIDVLINNAGCTRDNLAIRMKDEDWQIVFDINVTAAFKLARACIKGMMKMRWGRIISITSIVGVSGNAGQANYAASKAAMIGMSKSLAQEVASRGITVNCIAPGFVSTAMTEEISDKQKQRLSDAIPLGRFGKSSDIASAAVFLASDEASYITGQTMHVNGGMIMP